MFQFFVILSTIFILGPGINEGGFKAVEAKKEQAVVQAWAERKPYNSGKLKTNHTGNFGND